MPIADWGAVATGYYLPRFPEIRTELDAVYKARLGADRNTAHGTIDGSLVDFVADVVSRLFQADQANYQAHFFDHAEASALDDWLAPRGFQRRPAFATRVTVTPTGTAATVVPSGSVVRVGDDGELFSTESDATIGTDDVVLVAQNTGPIPAGVGVDWQIVTTVSGWTGISHTLETAVVGDDLETDPELKSRYFEALVGFAAAQVANVNGVTSVTPYQNDTDTPDSLYSATHWVEFLVVGGEDQDLINTIWQAKCPGISTQGDTGGTETVTGDGNAVRFSRGGEEDITLTIAITAGVGFPSGSGAEDQLEANLATWGAANHGHGDGVSRDMVVAEIGRLHPDSRFTVTSFTASHSGDSSSTLLELDPRDIARFDADDITVTIT